MNRAAFRVHSKFSSPTAAALRIAGLFVAASLAWIWFTDYLLLLPYEVGASDRFVASAGKGTLYTGVVSLLIFWLVRRHLLRVQDAYGLLEAVTNETTDAVFVKDLDGKYLFFNEAAARFVGRPVAEVLGRDDRELFDPESAAIIMAHDREAAAGGRPTTHQEHLTAAGVARVYSVTKAPFRDSQGEVIGLFGISRDVSQQILIQAELAQTERESRELADAIPQIVFISGPDGGMTRLNRRASEYAGVAMDALTEWKWEQFVHPDDRAHTLAKWKETLETGIPQNIEFRLRRADGAYRWHVGKQVPSRDGSGAIRRWYGTCTDIQDQYDRQADLEASESRLRLALQGANGGVWDWNLNTSESWWSEEMYDLWGVPRGTPMTLESSLAAIHEDDRDAVRKAAHGCAETGGEFRTEFRIVGASGGVRWMIVRGRLHSDPQGQPVRLVGITFDVTERRRAELELQEARYFTQRIADITPSVLYVYDIPSQRNIFSNRAAADALNIDRERLQQAFGHGLAGMMHENDLRGFAERIAVWNKLKDGEIAAPFEYRLRHTDGSWHWFASRDAVFARSANGNVSQIIGIATDVTDQKRAESAIRESEARFRKVFENAATGIAITDLAGRLERCNPEYCRLLGYEESALLGKTFSDFVHPEDRGENLILMRELIEGRLPAIEIENRYQCKNGKDAWVRKFVSLLTDENSKPTQMLALVTDTTERKAAEAQLRQAQKMEAVGRLAGGVAHDFNNLLTIINGFAEIALSRATDPGLVEPIRMIRDAGAQAASVTQQLLAFSRKSMLAPKVIDLGEVVRDTERLLRRLLGEDIAFATKLGSDIPNVKLDPSLLTQILVNLAVNARDAMPKGGSLTLSTSTISMPRPDGTHARLPAGDYVMVTMQDTGVGMPADIQARIFEPFFTTKDVGKGTGLGLAVVLGIVEQSGGSIEVRSQSDQGTTFEICFPAASKTLRQVADAATTTPAARGKERLLLVEDEEAVRVMAAFALRSQGYHVLEAVHGKEAIRVIERDGRHIDMLVTDVVMPEMGGRELAETLKKKFAQLRILFVSGYTDDAVMRHGVEHQDMHFLPKPFTPLSLTKKVREILDAPG
ncbi:MAG: PAS domain S-box protein [Gemmataceae bacterium]|nr:PAS domain S-box protein [Gemmataceae bacterium]